MRNKSVASTHVSRPNETVQLTWHESRTAITTHRSIALAEYLSYSFKVAVVCEFLLATHTRRQHFERAEQNAKCPYTGWNSANYAQSIYVGRSANTKYSSIDTQIVTHHVNKIRSMLHLPSYGNAFTNKSNSSKKNNQLQQNAIGSLIPWITANWYVLLNCDEWTIFGSNCSCIKCTKNNSKTNAATITTT